VPIGYAAFCVSVVRCVRIRAHQSDHPSPMPPDCTALSALELAGPPVRRLETPWPYSWTITPVVEIAIAAGRRVVEEVHLHAAGRTIGRRGEVCVVGPGTILRVGLDGVVAETLAGIVGGLEISSGFGEAVARVMSWRRLFQ